MKKRINIQLIGMAVLAIFTTMFMMTIVFYEVFEKQVMEDLRLEATVLQKADLFHSGEDLSNNLHMEELRITWIAKDGTVLYDNDAEIGTMENHANRPEVEEALETGKGKIVRKSNTMNANTFYYAIRLDDGTVLRVAKEAGSIWSIFESSFPIIALLVAIITVIGIALAQLLTRKLIAPIEQMAKNMDDFSEIPVYKELVPFATTIRTQHENILEAAKMRQDFTANVSHELKTPLTAISGYAELIENKMVSEEQMVHFAKEIRSNVDRLLSLIGDIINLSELDRTEAQIPFEEVDLYDIAKSCAKTLSISAEQRKVHFLCEGEQCLIHGNRDLLAELITNLGENAIRYNREGGMVKIFVGYECEQPVLQVKDNGIGIPKEHQQHVFERFYRVDKSRSKETGGTGLGLAIVKHISAIHGATLKLESEVNEGTTVSVIF